MAQRTGQGASTLSQAAGGERLPTLPVVLAYVRACGGDEEEWEERWCEAAAEAAAEPRAEDEDAEPPYRGLARFEPADAALFFGRDELTDRLLELTRSRRFTAVFGPSGSGKSSLLRAGLIPRLRDSDTTESAPAALRVLTPGEHPLSTHAQRLVPAEGEGDTWLVVDQFEELYTLCDDVGERDQFIDRLVAAADPENRLRVVISVRADFFGRCAEHPALTAALQDGTVLVGPMCREDLRNAIVRPAQATGLIVERALTARILDEVEDEPGALPLMSHALLETWRRRKGRALTESAYESAGGLRGAITRTAEDVHASLTPTQTDLARRVLLRLITPGAGTPDTRRPAQREECDFADPDDTAIVLNRLTRARLVILDENTVGIAHEALITGWPRLRQWIHEARERLSLHRQLTEAARAWSNLGRDPGALYRGTRLAVAAEAFTDPGDLTALEKDFLAASLDARRQEQRAATRTTRRLRALSAALAVLVLLASMAAVTAFDQRSTARSQRDIAVSRQLTAEAAELRSADTSYKNQNVSVAAQLDITAYRMHPSPQAYTDLVNATATPLFSVITDKTPDQQTAVLGPDGHTLATTAGDGRIRLWDANVPTEPRQIGRPITGSLMAFSPHGHTLATIAVSTGTHTKGMLRMWDTTHPADLIPLGAPVPVGDVDALTFSSDGQTLAITSDTDDGANTQVQLWDTSQPAHPSRRGSPLPNTGATFSPTGHLLATVRYQAEEDTVQLWDVTRPAHATRLGKPLPGADVLFSPRGNMLVTSTVSSEDFSGSIQLWDITRSDHAKRLGRPLQIPHADLSAMAFSPDDHVLATALDNTVRLWNVTNADGPIAVGQPLGQPGVNSLGFGPDGHTLVAAGNTIRVWALPPTFLTGRGGSISAVSFSPDGATLATVTDFDTFDANTRGVLLWDVSDPASPRSLGGQLLGTTAAFSPRDRVLATAGSGRVWLWDTHDPAHPKCLGPPLRVSGNWITSVAFSPDGHTLAAAVEESEIYLWDTRDPAHPKRVGKPLTSTTGDLTDVAFSADGRTLASTNDDEGSFWDISERHPKKLSDRRTGLGLLLGNGANSFAAVAFSPDGHALATAGDDEDVRLWHLPGSGLPTLLGNPLKEHSKPVSAVAYSPGGRAIATGSEDGTARLWDLDVDRAIRRICAATQHTLTEKEWRQYVGDIAYQPPCS
ncbi:hypothetical protein N8I87_41835 [Streptomyces sp. HUAS TT20]|nr:hypothetical protein [Streptomyces sp. HUAS 15-9]UXY32393.1 hypothetical protein N8I87_41835 [Streptomyces sp. HUAS 15-9]